MKPLPRFATPVTVSRSPRALLRPFPQSATALGGERVRAHEELATRYGSASAAAIALRRKVEEAHRHDADAAEKALRAGSAIPAPKAPALVDKLSAAERELDSITTLVPESALAALAELAPSARGMTEQADERADALEQEALELLDQASKALTDANLLRAEGAWAHELYLTGVIPPFTGRAGRDAGSGAVTEARRAVEWERQRREERRVQLEHDRETADTVTVDAASGHRRVLPPPPGPRWDGDRGELVEAETPAA